MMNNVISASVNLAAVISRFEKYYIPEPNSGCYLWIGGATGKYGRFNWAPANNYAHRASHILFKGPIPEGEDVCHSCDLGLCVNPDHLFPGTRSINIRDMMTKGRAAFQKDPGKYRAIGLRMVARGDRYQPNQKLVASDIPIILYLIERGCFHVDIAKVFGVHKATIANIAKGETWEWVQ